jgi:hypothetical protein
MSETNQRFELLRTGGQHARERRLTGREDAHERRGHSREDAEEAGRSSFLPGSFERASTPAASRSLPSSQPALTESFPLSFSFMNLRQHARGATGSSA